MEWQSHHSGVSNSVSRLDKGNTTWQLLFCIQKAEILAYSTWVDKLCKVLLTKKYQFVLRPARTLRTTFEHLSHRYSKEDTQCVATHLGMNVVLKSALTKRNIIFHTLLKPPKVSVSSLTCACLHCMQAVKMLGCETFPEFHTVPLDRESHSFSICLKIPNHRLCDKSMLHINSHKLQMGNTGNLCSSYLL